ncbi:ester cyclase [Jannaschia rubra]|uniref:ester cyclase n=1 Tax=Jannaschia rubra TaxID=282197 RepID=UPI002490465F|nr:ester cyclase [Jannaschia rubra]
MLHRLGDCDATAMEEAVRAFVTADAAVHLFHPLGDVTGGAEFVRAALGPLWAAFPDAERRVDISMTGVDGHGETWLGQAGHYAGRFAAPFLDVPPTGRLAFLRFHEFYRLEDDRAVEVHAIWDLPDLMMQAGVWPMGPALGRSGLVPGPMTQDGLRVEGDGRHAMKVVGDMLDRLHLSRQGEAAMDLPAAWHPRCNWYGPGGIGTARGIRGFRDHHQIPFLDAMPDRRGLIERGHFFAQGDYVAFTAWPGMEMTVSGDGWLGIVPSGRRITMRSLDFWRVEGDRIRENWVCVDLLDAWHQLGVDVLHRMRQLA